MAKITNIADLKKLREKAIAETASRQEGKFRIVIGPMRLAEFQRFLPGSPSLRRLVDWVRNYIGDELLWDVNLVLRRDEVPPLQLGAGTQLGWTTWLSSGVLPRDADDLKLDALTYCT